MRTKRYHIIIDLANLSNDILTDKDGLINFLNSLPEKINMHVLQGPYIAEGIPENPGLSGFVLIDFSHISVHTFTDHNDALVDIFSCKTFEQEEAIKATLEYFKADRSQANIKVVSWE